MRRLLFATVVALAGCRVFGGGAGGAASPEPMFPAGWTILDLTRPLDAAAPYVPYAEAFPFERREFKGPREHGWRTGGYSGLEHMGTHLAAPLARLAVGDSVEKLPAAQLVAPLVVVDAPESARIDGGTLSVADLVADEKAHGPIPVGAAVVLRTGRGALAGNDPAYGGRRPDGTFTFPGWGEDAVRWLAIERRVRAVGTDALAVDSGANVVAAPAQTAGSAAGLWFGANLADLSRAPRRGAALVVGAVPIAGAAGAPARVLALVPPATP